MSVWVLEALQRIRADYSNETRQAYAKAIALLEKALKRNSDYVDALALLAFDSAATTQLPERS